MNARTPGSRAGCWRNRHDPNALARCERLLVAVMVSQVLGLAFLWSQGFLSARRLREMRDLFGPGEKEAVAFDTEPSPSLPSSQDVLRERSLRVLSLGSLETEVGLLKSMIENERNGLIAQRADFQKEKAAFNTQLQQLADKNVTEAREQSRSVLLALPPADAVDRLMQLPVNEDVLLSRDAGGENRSLAQRVRHGPRRRRRSVRAQSRNDRTHPEGQRNLRADHEGRAAQIDYPLGP